MTSVNFPTFSDITRQIYDIFRQLTYVVKCWGNLWGGTSECQEVGLRLVLGKQRSEAKCFQKGNKNRRRKGDRIFLQLYDPNIREIMTGLNS